MFNLINKVRNRKGFTLVELLVVLAVLAIISAIAIPRFAGVQDSAKEKADKETINIIERALELCVTTEGVEVTADTVLGTLTSSGFTVPGTNPTIQQAKINEYLEAATATLQHYTSVEFTLDKDGNITSVSN